MNEAEWIDSIQAPAAHPPCVPKQFNDNGTILAMGRRFRSAVDRFAALDRHHTALAIGADDEPVVRCWMHRADAERHRLFDRVFARRAETLADAAVLAAHGFHRADVMLDLHRDETMLGVHLGQLRAAFANILLVTAAAAGLDIGQIGYPTLARSVRATLAMRRAG